MLNQWVVAQYKNSKTRFYVRVSAIDNLGVFGAYYGQHSRTRQLEKWGNSGLWPWKQTKLVRLVENKKLIKKLEKLEKSS